jgi:hypothetical protein
MINSYQLFSVSVIETKIIIQAPLLKKVINWCEKNNKTENYISIRGGFQEHENFDGKKELDQILNCFLRVHMREEIAHGWLNVLNKNGDNIPHRHSGDIIKNSGVLYLTNNNSAISFIKDSQVYSFYPKLYDFIFFPHDLIHQVSTHTEDKFRISYAINTKNIK